MYRVTHYVGFLHGPGAHGMSHTVLEDEDGYFCKSV